jgi:protein subunit release factor A
MNWPIIGALGVAVVTGIFALIQAQIATKSARDANAARIKADNSANTTKLIETGVTDLINQYRSRVEELLDDIHECSTAKDALEQKFRGEIRVLEAKVLTLTRELHEALTTLDNMESENIRLKIKAGEV